MLDPDVYFLLLSLDTAFYHEVGRRQHKFLFFLMVIFMYLFIFVLQMPLVFSNLVSKFSVCVLPEKANGLAATENSSVFSTVSINNTSTPAGTIVVTGASSVGSSIGNLSEDSNTQDSIPSSTGATSPVTTRTRRPYRGRGGYRGRWAYYHQTAPLRRKQKLKEVS